MDQISKERVEADPWYFQLCLIVIIQVNMQKEAILESKFSLTVKPDDVPPRSTSQSEMSRGSGLCMIFAPYVPKLA